MLQPHIGERFLVFSSLIFLAVLTLLCRPLHFHRLHFKIRPVLLAG